MVTHTPAHCAVSPIDVCASLLPRSKARVFLIPPALVGRQSGRRPGGTMRRLPNDKESYAARSSVKVSCSSPEGCVLARRTWIAEPDRCMLWPYATRLRSMWLMEQTLLRRKRQLSWANHQSGVANIDSLA